MTQKTQMERVINKTYSNTAGIVVQKKGETIYETYRNDCSAESYLHVFSVTKSIVSMLIGIAMEKGLIKSTDQHVLDFFPDYTVRKGEKTIQKITLDHLLSMTAPYRHKTEPYMDYFKSEDWVKFSLDALGGNGKIGEFRYAPLIGPDLYSGILTHVTGQSTLDFAKANLFAPLGMEVGGPIVFESKEEQLEYYKATNINGWVADATGINAGGWGLTLTPPDMAKLGQLYLNGGLWSGKQIVPNEWVKTSTRKHSSYGKLDYGYLWWIIDEKEHAFAAMGDGGNIIYVNEKKDLVIAMASLFVKNAGDRLKLIRNYMEPVFC